MGAETETLPDDIQGLRNVAVELQRALAEALQNIQTLSEKIRLLEHLHFGKKSERFIPDDPQQQRLFDEAEAHADGKGSSVAIAKQRTARKESGKKPGRRPIPADLRREEIIHDLPEPDKLCPCCGKARPAMGDERTEEVEIIPAKVVVHVHVRKIYGACACEAFAAAEHKEVVTANGEAKLIPGSSFSNRSVAMFMVWKFLDGLPFYRIEHFMPRYGLAVPRATLCNLALGAGRAIGDLIALMQRDIRLSPVVRMDETSVQVLKEPNRPPTSESYMWVTMGYRDERPIILFAYHPTRGSIVPKTTLAGYKGFLQTDGYGSYDSVGKQEGIAHVGCWAHIRREFFEAAKVTEGKNRASEMLELIKGLYALERALRIEFDEGKIDRDGFVTRRRTETATIFESIWSWLLTVKGEVPPKSALGRAIEYAIGQYPKAVRYIGHFLLTPDNNLTENAIRPFVIGRNNWLFFDTQHGCHASAGIYSVLQTAKQNGHDPYRYLCFLFSELPKVRTAKDLERLRPYVLEPGSF